MVNPALTAGEMLGATVVNMRFVKPLDENLLIQLANMDHELFVTLEENAIMGGAGSAVAELLHQQGITTQVLQLGLPDRFIEHGNPKELLMDCHLDVKGILFAIENRVRHPQVA